uniref:Uncharacterized protein n=1 Tax=Rhizophora mucronata TaxID=61149 RepID=A0A2P2QUA2_RHIMU
MLTYARPRNNDIRNLEECQQSQAAHCFVLHSFYITRSKYVAVSTTYARPRNKDIRNSVE